MKKIQNNSEKNPATGLNSGKEDYHLIWEVNHRICQEIWLNTLKSEDLWIVLKKSFKKKKEEIFKLWSFVHEVKSTLWNFEEMYTLRVVHFEECTYILKSEQFEECALLKNVHFEKYVSFNLKAYSAERYSKVSNKRSL